MWAAQHYFLLSLPLIGYPANHAPHFTVWGHMPQAGPGHQPFWFRDGVRSEHMIKQGQSEADFETFLFKPRGKTPASEMLEGRIPSGQSVAIFLATWQKKPPPKLKTKTETHTQKNTTLLRSGRIRSNSTQRWRERKHDIDNCFSPGSVTPDAFCPSHVHKPGLLFPICCT